MLPDHVKYILLSATYQTRLNLLIGSEERNRKTYMSSQLPKDRFPWRSLYQPKPTIQGC